MRHLRLPAGFPFPTMATALADGDTMYDGRDEHYLGVGLSALAVIERALHGRTPRAILDLPCGFGRVARILRARYPLARITACDLDRAGVDFTARHFQARAVYSVEDLGALSLGGGFDLIWVGSLVTHLSEAQTCAFLDSMAASMASGAVLAVTSHGPSIAPALKDWGYGLEPASVAAVLDGYRARGYGHHAYGGGGGNGERGGNGYGISLTDAAWWQQIVADRGLQVASYTERGWDDHQDVVILRRRSDAPDESDEAVHRDADRAALAAYDPVLRWFDTAHYLDYNPDVRAAIASGDYASAYDHYRRNGRQEGRTARAGEPGAPGTVDMTAGRFDEVFYRSTNADVDAAVRLGAFGSGLDHYERFGRAEGRSPCAAARPDGDARPPAAERPMTTAERGSQVAALWSQNTEQAPGWYWMAHPMVRARLNTMASGDPATDSYGHLASLLRQRGVALPIERAVSLGCGFGGLERDLAARGLIQEIDAYDIAPGAIAEARRLAQEGGFTGLRYHVADLETEDFTPGLVDIVFAHQSVHHVERLDELFIAVSAMLKPGGIFHLHEFVGPIRFQWTEAQIAEVNRFIEALPPRLRALPSGQPRPLQGRASVAAMIAADPSEAIRSSEILPVLRRHFDIQEIRPLGGAMLHLALSEIAQNFDPDAPEDCAVLETGFADEDAAMRDGRLGSDFVVITAVKPDQAGPHPG